MERVAPVPQRSRHEQAAPPLRLVVWLTVDQLRGDTFHRFAHLLTEGGFRRLLREGMYYPSASYRHALTETAPGHATLFTGAAPREHGIVSNEWLSPDGLVRQSVSDSTAPLLGPALTLAEQNADAGRSPRQLLLPTVGDAMRQASLGRARVVAVSAKDRGAVLPAGRSGQAYWLGKAGFVTSRYYFDTSPEHLTRHHEAYPPAQYRKGGWPLLLAEEAYRGATATTLSDSLPLGPRFPHVAPPDMDDVTAIKASPALDRATLDLAQHLLAASSLGTDDIADLLSISLSATDYIGHAYGPESREAEDNFARLDRLLAAFLTTLDERFGREHTLIVLSSDHGICETPETLTALGLPAGRLLEAELEKAARGTLSRLYGTDAFLLGVKTPSVYLDHQKVREAGKDLQVMRRELAAGLRDFPGVRETFAFAGPTDNAPLGRQVHASTRAGRSGDVYVVAEPYVQLSQDAHLTATHGSPWSYDAHVPIILAGYSVPHGVARRSADVRSLAGTVAAIVGVSPPAGASRELLVEALAQH